jgi:hypothetical protein
VTEKNISYGDLEKTRSALLALKNVEIDESVKNLYQKKLELAIQLFDFGADAFKTGQEVIEGFDTRILNEHQYFSRAQNTLLNQAQKGSLDIDSLFAIDDALSAVRHIVNDTLDLIVLHAGKERNRLNKICQTVTISDVYPEYDKARATIVEVNKEIAETRRVRGVLRVEKYIHIFTSGKYADIVNFCHSINEIEDRLKKKKAKEYIDSKRFWIGASIAIAGLIATIIIKLLAS